MSTKLKLDSVKLKSFVTGVEESKIVGGQSHQFGCNSNLTCNTKCGATAYWECG